MELDPGGNSGVLIDTNTANYCSFNKNALLILRKLKKGKATIFTLTKEITNKNSVSLSVARKDVSIFLTKLKNMNLINE